MNLVPVQYKSTRDKISQYLHCVISTLGEIRRADIWFKHHHDVKREEQNITFGWDFPACAGLSMKANKPNIAVKEQNNKLCLLIGRSIACNHNISGKEYDNLRKHRYLPIEVKQTVKMPVIIGALEMIGSKK